MKTSRDKQPAQYQENSRIRLGKPQGYAGTGQAKDGADNGPYEGEKYDRTAKVRLRPDSLGHDVDAR